MPDNPATTTTAASAWPDLLPSSIVKEWAELDPQAPSVLLQEITRDARHLRRMAWARLLSAVTVFGSSLGISAYFAAAQGTPWSAASAGAGTLVVATILLTGRPPALRRR